MPNEVYYILLAAKSGEAHKVEDKLVLYETRDDATTDAAALREANPDQHYLIEGPHTTDRLDWKARERARLEDKTHLPLIHDLAQYTLPEHFAHVAKGDPRSLAYTKNEADGIRDIQKRMNVVAYLEAYAKHLDGYQRSVLQRMHQNMASAAELLIATDGDAIQQVYQKHNDDGGVGASCMRHDISSFAGHAHPVQAYGDSDLAVAYTKDSRGCTTARAIVWPAKRCYSRMYGGEQYLPELKRLMIAAGYKPSKGYYGHCSDVSDYSLDGARLKAIKDEEDRGRYIVPYLDECNIGVLDDAKEWITILNAAPPGAKTISIKETSGVSRVSGPRCPSCRSTNTGDATFINAFTTYPADEGQVSQHCSSCVGAYTFVCTGTGQRYNSDQVDRASVNGQPYVRAWARANLAMCGCCDTFNRPERLLPYRKSLAPEFGKICPDCAAHSAFWCEEAEELVSNDLRIRAFDVGARKRIVFGGVAKLIDRSFSILSRRAAEDSHWSALHTIALAELERGPVELCQVDAMTGMPITVSNGRLVRRFPNVALVMRNLRVGYKPIVYALEIEARILRAGDWVRVSDAMNFPEAAGCVGLIVADDDIPIRRFTVTLIDGREAFCEGRDLIRLSAAEAEGLILATRSDPHVGEMVMFAHYSSPRFGQRGVVERIEEHPEDTSMSVFVVRFPDEATRRAQPRRLQRIGPEVEPDPNLPMDLPVPEQPSNMAYRPNHVWQVGDRVEVLPNCVEVSIPAREIGQEATVISLEDGQPRIIRMETGHPHTGDEWHVRAGMVELLETVVETSAAE